MIKLKNDTITNIIDDSWSQENKSEFTDFGTTINTDLFFKFENNNNFRFKQYDGLSPFEISMWLIKCYPNPSK